MVKLCEESPCRPLKFSSPRKRPLVSDPSEPISRRSARNGPAAPVPRFWTVPLTWNEFPQKIGLLATWTPPAARSGRGPSGPAGRGRG